MRILTRLFLLASCLTFALGAAAKEPLRVGIAPDYPPLAYRESGDLSGIEVALAEVLGKQLDRKIKYVEKDFADLIPALQAGEIDIIMSGLSITPERSQQVDFSKPYLQAGQMGIIRFADAGRLSFKGAIFRPGTTVAVVRDSTGETFAKQRLQAATVTTCASLDEAFALLQGGKVDFLLHDAPTNWALASDKSKEDLMSQNHALTEEQLGWAVRKDNQALLQAVNAQLDTMQRNGMLRAIIRKWIPVTVEVTETQSRSQPVTSSNMTIRPAQGTTSTTSGKR